MIKLSPREKRRKTPTRASAARGRPKAALVTAITAVTLALASVAFAAPAASATASASIPVTARTAASVPAVVKADMNTLYQFLDPVSGLIGGSWWQAAVALSTIETYQQTTGDRSFEHAFLYAFSRNNSGAHFENNFDDDTAWWGLAWLQAYAITRYGPYLDTAEDIAGYIHGDWDNACGGGVWWQRSPHKAKNAIANELFLELTAWLYNTTHIKMYRTWAIKEWDWFDGSKMITKSYLVHDGLPDSQYSNPQCGDGSIATNYYTYNQGVILAGLAQLYKATGKRTYLTEALDIANAATNPKNKLVVNNVLTEPTCKPGKNCGGDAESFKGIFVRNLKVLAVIANTTRYNKFFIAQAQSIEKKDTASHPANRLGMFWAGPLEDLTTYSQASALDALVASLDLPKGLPG